MLVAPLPRTVVVALAAFLACRYIPRFVSAERRFLLPGGSAFGRASNPGSLSQRRGNFLARLPAARMSWERKRNARRRSRETLGFRRRAARRIRPCNERCFRVP